MRSIAILVLCLLVACGEKNAASGSSSAAASKPADSSKPAASSGATTSSAAPVEAPATKGEVELQDKKKVAFSITLPPDLKDVSEVPYIKQYAKEAKKYDGYSFTIKEPKPALVKAGVEAIAPEAAKAKKTFMQKGGWANGWFLIVDIEENGKKAVILTSLISEGDVHLECRGNVEGELAAKPQEVSETLIATCKSLKITPP